MDGIRVIGGGPAGASAALAARREGVEVTLFEQSTFPRHKVCGEFLSPEAASIFERLGILGEFQELKPWVMREAEVRFGRVAKHWKLDEPAFGISRFALDQFLIAAAKRSGTRVITERAQERSEEKTVLACGRRQRGPKGGRTFGFKAHFRGPVSDRIELFFDREVYLGINSIENGMTNVCGLASETLLREHGFQPDRLLATVAGVSERLSPLEREMDWLITGPLLFGDGAERVRGGSQYLAGDALGFIDPFTGSGMLAALSTGMSAGYACALGLAPGEHYRQCRRMLGRQYLAAGLFRKLIGWGIADSLLWMIPGRTLFDLTRPASIAS